MAKRLRRQRDSGALRQLPSARWQPAILEPGNTYTSLGTFGTRAEAEKTLAAAIADRNRGNWIDPRDGRVTFEAYSKRWLHERTTLRPRTRELYEVLLRLHIVPSFAQRELGSITPPMVRRWHAEMSRADRPGQVTIAKCYRLLRTILATAVEDGLIVKSPCVIKGAGVERSPERPVATIAQVEQIAGAIDPCFRMLILMATFTGLRFGELAALTRRKIDLDAGTVSVTVAQTELSDGTRVIGEPKTAAGRRLVAIPPVLLEDLRAHLDRFAEPGADGLVFIGPKGGPLRRGNWSVRWTKTVGRLGLDGLHFHDLRHTGNTLAASTGASTRELMTRMGHSSARAALIYQHASADRELAIGRALSDMIERERAVVAER